MQMRVKMQQPAYKCEKMQMRAVFVNGPISAVRNTCADCAEKLLANFPRWMTLHESDLKLGNLQLGRLIVSGVVLDVESCMFVQMIVMTRLQNRW